MRSFALLALGSVYNPGTGNDVSLKYLNSLENVELISTFDWAGHILKELMDEVKKYQKFSPERLEKDHQIGSCLIILAVCVTFFSLFPMISHRCVLFLYVVLLKNFCINSRFICFFCFFPYRSPTWTTLICHLTEATKSTTVYPAFAMSGMRTSTL
jgi:hypothetical protein